VNELSLDLVHSQMSKQQSLSVDAGTVEEINKLVDDPEYGEEFLESYVDHLNVLKDNPKYTHDKYLKALKFFTLIEADNSLTDAYIKTFPERYEARQNNHSIPKKDIMRSEASRYNKTRLVNEIRRVATIPIQLIHRHLLHEAILTTAKLMQESKSDMVKQKAADTLIRELKPAEENTLNVKVDDGSVSVIAELHAATKALAAEQHKSAMAGVPLREITQARIINGTATEVEDD